MPDRGSERGQDGGDGFATCGCELIAVRAGDFRDQSVSTKQSKLPADPPRAAPGILLGLGGTGEEDSLQIPVAEPMDGELAAVSCFQECAVVAKRRKRAHPAAAPLFGLSEAPDQFFQRGVLVDTGEGVQVALGRLAGDLGPAMPRRIRRQASSSSGPPSWGR